MLSISNSVNGDINVIKLTGRLDAKASRQAEEALSNAVEAAPNVVLDMSDLDYIASAGLRVLKRLQGDVKACGGSLVLRDVQEDVMEVLEMTGFAVMLTFE